MKLDPDKLPARAVEAAVPALVEPFTGEPIDTWGWEIGGPHARKVIAAFLDKLMEDDKAMDRAWAAFTEGSFREAILAWFQENDDRSL